LFSYTLAATDLKGHSWVIRQANGRPYNRRLVQRATHEWGARAEVPQCLPPPVPPYVRDGPPTARRGRPGDSEAARPRRLGDDPGLHRWWTPSSGQPC